MKTISFVLVIALLYISSYVAFSDNDIQQVAKYFIEKESFRKTSARNSFFGKITTNLYLFVQVVKGSKKKEIKRND